MNFLAHAFLSGNDPDILTGNFIADFIKGKQALQTLPSEIAKGVALHRMIDAFTDEHPVVKESKNRLRPKYRHYAAVIVDVFYDHFLARDWTTYHYQPLETFASRVYQTIETNQGVLPEGMRQMFPYMVRGDWLVGYSKVEGISRSLTGMSRRTTFDSKMDEATFDLIKHEKLFQYEFETFFPDLRDMCKTWLAANTN